MKKRILHGASVYRRAVQGDPGSSGVKIQLDYLEILGPG